MPQRFKTSISWDKDSRENLLSRFCKKIEAEIISETEFVLSGEKWLVDWHPSTHSKDIIIEKSLAERYDRFLLIMEGSQSCEIVGWTDRESLMSVPPRDIYRNGIECYVVHDTNVQDLSSFKIIDESFSLKESFVVNQQEAENLGHTEMISGILAGIHYFAKQAGKYFKDLNQKDLFMLGEKKVKIYTRDYLSDEDMLIPEKDYKKENDVDLYILCKIKGGNYSYLGYVKRETVDETRIVRMTGNVDLSEGESEDIRRIFAEQYLPLSDLLEIWEQKEKEEEEIEPQNYVPLHVHSEWSVGDGFGTTNYLAEILKRKGFQACALTDHGTMAGVWEFQKSCLLKGVKPILGTEFYMGFQERAKERFHLTVLVKNEEGWRNLLKLQAISVREGFYYKPIISIDDLLKHKEGLVVLSGCDSGLIPSLLKEGRREEAKQYALVFKEAFKEDFYLEIQPHAIENNQEIMKEVFSLSKETSIKPVMTNDVHYPKKEDKIAHDAIKAINFKKKFGEAGYSDDCFYFMTERELEERLQEKSPWMLPYFKDWLKTTLEIAEKCQFAISPGEEKDTLPKLEFEGKTRAEKLRELCREGITKNTKYTLDNKEVSERLELEVERILSKEYENYFLIVADLINWCKEKGIMTGPGRGCFLPGNTVSLHRHKKKIESVKIGDMALTHDRTYQRVSNKFEYDVDEEICILELENGKKISCTKDHLIMTDEGFVPAENIRRGTLLMGAVRNLRCNRQKQVAKDKKDSQKLNDSFHNLYKVKSIVFKKYKGKVYDLQVENVMNYTVSDITVHNSVGASLVALALGITACDPIEHDLLFDRFLSEIRRDMPDIDMDFQDNRREEVFDYLREKYGEHHCAKIATYSRFHPKGVLRDVGRIFSIPSFEINKICSLVIERSGGDARQSFALSDTFAEFDDAKQFKQKYPLASEIALKLEGGIRHRSSHAAAMVVSEKEIESYAPINKIGGVICLEWEKQLVEDMNLIKFDILGLKTLTIIKDAADSAGVELPREFEDKRVYEEVFKDAKTNGIFQLGCISGDTLIGLRNKKSIKELFLNNFRGTLLSFDGKNLRRNKVMDIQRTGIKKVFRLRTKSGKEITATDDHKFLTSEGTWKTLKELGVGERIKAVRDFLIEKNYNLKEINGFGNLKTFCKSCHMKEEHGTEVFDDEIVSIEYQGEEETFDISMKAPWHNYIASNLIVHNTVGMQKFSAGLNISSFPDLYDATTLFRPSCLHCVSGETRIRKQKGNIRLKELYRLQEEDKKLPKILDGKGIPKTPIKIWKNGKQQLFELQVNHAHARWGGNKIFATSKHKFLTDSGWKTLGELKEGDEVYVLKREYPKWSKVKVRIKSIKKAKIQETFDITMPKEEPSYIANDFVVHNSGQASVYASRKKGEQEVEYFHETLKPITKGTKGVILYQEQIMQIMNQVAGLSWATAEMARKVITKSKGKDAFNKMRQDFVAGAKLKSNMEKEEAEKLFDIVSTFGCLTGDTKIYRASSNQYTKQEMSIREAYDYQDCDNFKHKKLKILAMGADGFVRPHAIKKIHYTGKKPVFYLRTSGGKTIKASENHRFYLHIDGKDEWLAVNQIKVGDLIRTTDLKLPKKAYGSDVGIGNHKDRPRARKGQGKTNDKTRRKKELLEIYKGCQICSSKRFLELHHKDKNHNNNSKENTMLLCRKHHREFEDISFSRFRTGYYTQWERVEELVYSSERDTYDIEMEDSPKTFIANGFVSHNSYGFNKAHAVEYSMISYWGAWLKTYYPKHFYKAYLKVETDDSEIRKMVQDAKDNGIEMEYPEINTSEFSYSIFEDKIYAGLNSVIGIGEKTAQKIIERRPYVSFEDFKKRAKVSDKILKGLIAARAFRKFNICAKTEFYEDHFEEDFSEKEWSQIMYERTNLTPKESLADSFDFGRFKFTDISDLAKKKNEFIFLRGIITNSLKKDNLLRESQDHVHKFEKRLLYLNLSDDTGSVAIQINPETFEKYQKLLEHVKKSPVVVFGKNNSTGTKVLADMIEIVDGEFETRELRDLVEKEQKAEANESFIVSARPAVSAKKNSYYRVRLSNGESGLCFRFKEKLFPGQKVKFSIREEPFINLELVGDA